MIGAQTRRSIFDTLRVERVSWSGELDDVAFLQRLYDLTSMISYDGRFKDAANDIWQHRVNNPFDWADDWIYDDARFNLMDSPDDALLRFLCEMLHPVVRADAEEVERLAGFFNKALRSEGWQITGISEIAGRPVYGPTKLLVSHASLESASAVVQDINADYLTQQLARMRSAVEEDPELAIGTAKEFVETICKTILQDKVGQHTDKLDFPKLVKSTIACLNLLPDDTHRCKETTGAVRSMLNGLATVTQSIAEIRNLQGNGHGKDVSFELPPKQLAGLVVGSATALAVFLYEMSRTEESEQ